MTDGDDIEVRPLRVDDAAEALYGAGFAFGAWRPGWAGHDVLRLQRVRDLTEAELAPDLLSPGARELLQLIRAELREVA